MKQAPSKALYDLAGVILTELRDLDYMTPNDPDDPDTQWHLTKAGSALMVEWDKALGIVVDGMGRPLRGQKIVRLWKRDQVAVAEKIKRAGAWPQDLSDPAGHQLLSFTIDVIRDQTNRWLFQERMAQRHPAGTA